MSVGGVCHELAVRALLAGSQYNGLAWCERFPRGDSLAGSSLCNATSSVPGVPADAPSAASSPFTDTYSYWAQVISYKHVMMWLGAAPFTICKVCRHSLCNKCWQCLHVLHSVLSACVIRQRQKCLHISTCRTVTTLHIVLYCASL